MTRAEWVEACRTASYEERERLFAAHPEWHFYLPPTVESPVPNPTPRDGARTYGPSEEQWDEWNREQHERDHGPEI